MKVLAVIEKQEYRDIRKDLFYLAAELEGCFLIHSHHENYQVVMLPFQSFKCFVG